MLYKLYVLYRCCSCDNKGKNLLKFELVKTDDYALRKHYAL